MTSVHVHLSGATVARVILAAALLLVALLGALVCAPGLLLWPFYPDRVGQLLASFTTWTRAILSPADLDAAATLRPGQAAQGDPAVVVQLDRDAHDSAHPPTVA